MDDEYASLPIDLAPAATSLTSHVGRYFNAGWTSLVLPQSHSLLLHCPLPVKIMQDLQHRDRLIPTGVQLALPEVRRGRGGAGAHKAHRAGKIATSVVLCYEPRESVVACHEIANGVAKLWRACRNGGMAMDMAVPTFLRRTPSHVATGASVASFWPDFVLTQCPQDIQKVIGTPHGSTDSA